MRNYIPLMLLMLAVHFSKAQISWPNVPGSDIPILTDAVDSTKAAKECENSVFISPYDKNVFINGNNEYCSIHDTDFCGIYGSSNFSSADGGLSWTGNSTVANNNPARVIPAGRADPSVVIDYDGYFYNSYIYGQPNPNSPIQYDIRIGVSRPGGSYYQTVVDSVPGPSNAQFLDKPHLWIDNSSASNYFGNLYCGWIENNYPPSIPRNLQIVFKRSTDKGQTWQYGIGDTSSAMQGVISSNANGSGTTRHIGVNIQTGPNGEVYACWAIAESNSALTENAIGFARSYDGGANWQPAQRLPLPAINGMWHQQLGGGKTMEPNSFPSMTVNKQTGEIFIVWAEFTDTANGTDIYMITSTDSGTTWSAKSQVNQDQGLLNINPGSDQWFPWIACDEVSGALAVVYYDSRNFPANNFVNTFVSISYDQGQSWTDYKVNDANTEWNGHDVVEPPLGQKDGGERPGDYIGIDVYHGKAVPVWSDTRSYLDVTDTINPIKTTRLLSYAHPFDLPCPDSLRLYSAVIAGNDTIPGEAFYTVNDDITVAGAGYTYSVAPTGNVTMQAGNEIHLQDGFTGGGEFHAEIISSCASFSRMHTADNSSGIDNQTVPDKLNTPDFLVYPNPNNGSFKLELTNRGEFPVSISVVDFLGQSIVKINTINSYFYDIDLGNVTAGMFFVKVNYAGKTIAKRIIKE